MGENAVGMGLGNLVEDEAELAKAEGPLERLGAAAAAGPLVSRNRDFVQDLKMKMMMGMMMIMGMMIIMMMMTWGGG
jgi:hypothetical protein